MDLRSKSFETGDKIFARVAKNGRTIYNFMSESVSSIAEVISQIKNRIGDETGLVMVSIRNYNKGWHEEKPVVLTARRKGVFGQMIGFGATEQNEFFNQKISV